MLCVDVPMVAVVVAPVVARFPRFALGALEGGSNAM